MAITTDDQYRAAVAAGQHLLINKTSSRTAIATGAFTTLDIAGNPGAGVLAGTSTTAGVVPTDATAGFPTIDAFAGGATGYLNSVEYSNNVLCRIEVYDLLWKAGAYAFNANTALSSQPSYSSRVPGGTDYKGTQIWVECVTAFTGNPVFTVTYTNQDGTGSRSTGAVAYGFAPTVGRCVQLPLQAGDTGVQKIDNVQCGTATVGTFNVLVLRRLSGGRVRTANDISNYGPDLTKLPKIFADSALYMLTRPDSTATSVPEIFAHIING